MAAGDTREADAEMNLTACPLCGGGEHLCARGPAGEVRQVPLSEMSEGELSAAMAAAWERARWHDQQKMQLTSLASRMSTEYIRKVMASEQPPQRPRPEAGT